MSLERRARRILVVDDEPAIRELVALRLELAGHQVFTARDGYDALGQLADVRPEAMVLDINMPRLDGFGVLQRIRDLKITAPPTMVLTARNAPEDVRKAINLGARDYLSKPFRDDQLLLRMGRLLRPARQASSSTSS